MQEYFDSLKKTEGYAFYCYKPHAIWGMADVVMLEEPKFDPAKYKMVQPKEDATGTKNLMLLLKMHLNKFKLVGELLQKVNRQLLLNSFKNFQLTADDVSAMAYAISVEKTTS